MKKLTTKGREVLRVSKTVLVFALIFDLIFMQSSFANPTLVKLKAADIPALPANTCVGKPVIWSECANLLIGKCAVCESDESTWIKPKIDVQFRTWAVSYPKFSLADGECYTVAALRFCARVAPPGTKEKGTQYDNYGNQTGATDNPRVQLCAYHDPLDGMDTNIDRSPHRWMEPNDENSKTGRAVGAAVGISFAAGLPFLAFGGPILSIFAGLIGGIIMAIMANFNHYVFNNLGCVDLPVAKGPPAFCNNCWHTKYAVSPIIYLGYESTFLNPNVVLNFCFKDTANNGTQRKDPVQCDDSLLNVKNSPAIERITLSPVGPTYADTKSVSFSYTEAGELINDKREFTARISTNNPSQICVFMTKDITGKASNIEQGCIKRPGYMPLPLMSRIPPKSVDEDMKISVTFKEGSSEKIELVQSATNLQDAAQLNINGCKTLNQINFCAERKCISGGDASLGSCKTWDNKVCLVGYNTAPLVVVDKIKDTPVAAGIVPPNNVNKHDQGRTFKNKNAYAERGKEGDNPLDVIPNITLIQDALVYDPAVADDSSYIDDTKYNLRQLNPEELGLCIHDPTPADFFEQRKAGTYQYAAPQSCKQIKVELWGAGAGGTNGGGSGDDHGGGSGGYVNAFIPAKDGDKFTVVVGAGGLARANGKYSAISLGSTVLATATGGTISAAAGKGGYGSCADSSRDNCNIIYGEDGESTPCSYMKGGRVWDPSIGNFGDFPSTGNNSCNDIIPTPAGVGGCAADACSGTSVPGYSGPGADGMVKVSCSQFGPVQ
jgi:hypothetical protein